MTTTTEAATTDVIDRLAGIVPGSRLDALRAEKPITRDQAQASFLALFEPAEAGDIAATERFAIALFAVALHGRAREAGFYAERLAALPGGGALVAPIEAAAARAATRGPYGRFPAGPLSAEDVSGPDWSVDAETRAAVGDRLAAAFDHVHLLVFHPRDASRAALQRLLDARWSTTAVVTISQIVAFLAFQLRVVAGLEALAAA